jgi:hypothetical protein
MAVSNSTTDYASRDELIKMQSYNTVCKLDGLPHDLFTAYWRDVHGPLCSRLPGLGYYVQYHFAEDQFANLWPLPAGVKRMAVNLNGAVEIGFATTADALLFSAASPILYGDEFNLFAQSIAYNLPLGSKTLIDRQRDGVPSGPEKLHRIHLHLNGGSEASFPVWVSQWMAQLARHAAVEKVRLHLPDLYDNAQPAPPSPVVNHELSEERKAIAIAEIAFASPLAARLFFESEEFQSTIGEQTTRLRSVGAFLVTGVYTFVRDGAMTTAGLRGSRQAELIGQIGAANQTSQQVTRLFSSDAS